MKKWRSVAFIYSAPAKKNAPTATTTPITPPRLALAPSIPALGIVVAEVLAAGVVLDGAVPVGGALVGYAVVELALEVW